jgi:hypothetical protein
MPAVCMYFSYSEALFADVTHILGSSMRVNGACKIYDASSWYIKNE